MSDPYGPPPSEDDPQQPPQQPYGQPPYGQQPYGGSPFAQMRGPDGLTADERTWGGAAHWSALIGAFVAMAFLGPLIVLLAKGNTSPYVRQQAVESLNFQITCLIFGVVSFVLYKLVDMVVGLRVAPETEREGLDLAEHGERAYVY